MTEMHNPLARRAAAAIFGLAAAMLAGATPLQIRKNDVIPVRFDSQLSTAENHPGDTFTATAKDDGFFPRGTTFDGHVVHVSHKTDRHPASMDLAFDDVRLPDGTRRDIVGVPIPLTSKYVERDRDGHYVARATIRKDTAVGVGALAGFIVGALLHKPFEGTFIGTLAGILVADTAGDDKVLVINRGSEAGVLFQRNARFDSFSAATPPDRRDTPPPSEAASLNVKIGDRTVQYTPDLAPFNAGPTLMVPIQFTAKQLGLSYDESEPSIFAENDTHSLRFEENSSSYRIDGRSETLPASVVQRNGVWYAPASAFGGTVGH